MLENLKMLLGISEDDSDRDPVLRLIISNSTARLKNLLGGIDPPETLDHIVLDVSVARYNRIGSEGLSSHTVEGETMSFTDGDFEPYMSEIQAFLESQKETTRGRVRFI